MKDTRVIRQIKTLILEIILPVIVFGLISNYLIGSDYLLHKIAQFRPPYKSNGEALHVESQLLYLESQLRNKAEKSKVIFIGSSSVVAAIDAARINKIWEDIGVKTKAIKAGMTGLFAYELPLVKEYYLRPDVSCIVYMYNSWSMSDILHDRFPFSRWNTSEFFRYIGIGHPTVKEYEYYALGAYSEIFFMMKFRVVLQNILGSLFRGTIKKREHDFDHAPNSLPLKGKRKREFVKPFSSDNPVRAWYLSSDTDKSTRGYRGFRRFLQLAKGNNIMVVVLPVPEPEFAKYGPLKQGINEARIDKRVRDMTEYYEMVYIQRSETDFISEEDTYFWNHAHFQDPGREVFTPWIANRLMMINDGDGP